MKKYFTLFYFIFFLLSSTIVRGQDLYYFIDFDSVFSVENLTIDTISNPNNTWQIGIPQKEILSSSYSYPHVIITDKNNPYPINDTSSFYIKHEALGDYENGQFASLEGSYFVHSDSLADFGKIEFSPDNGVTWYDLLNEQFIQSWHNDLLHPYPIITGNSNGWKKFHFDAGYFCYSNQIDVNWGDTIIYKFSFVSDSIQTYKDGLMFDDFRFEDFIESVYEIGLNKIESTCYPNPVQNLITIRFDNPLYEKFDVFIYDVKGNILENFTTNKDLIEYSCDKLDNGFYYYKLVKQNDRLYAYGKFVKK